MSRHRRPQPLAARHVLAGDRCDHGELLGRCPLCRAAGLSPVGQPDAAPADATDPQPVAPGPPRRRKARLSEDDRAPVGGGLW